MFTLNTYFWNEIPHMWLRNMMRHMAKIWVGKCSLFRIYDVTRVIITMTTLHVLVSNWPRSRRGFTWSWIDHALIIPCMVPKALPQGLRIEFLPRYLQGCNNKQNYESTLALKNMQKYRQSQINKFCEDRSGKDLCKNGLCDQTVSLLGKRLTIY